jgi:peptide/nickel transport system substrate-binding protein
MAEFVDGPFPGTGPYVVDSVSGTEVRLVRNERFTVWDPSVRPDGYPDEIVFTASNDPDESVAMVASGAADYAYSSGAQSLPVFATEYPAQWHSGGVNTNFIELNTTIAPFDNVDARRAFSLALDRERMVEIGHGAHGAAVTCQFVSPGWNGYQPYCPYTRDPDQGGAWRGRDLEAAQALIDRSNTRGARVAVGPSLPWYAGEYAYIAEVLEELGYDVTFDPTTHEFEEFMATLSSERTQFMINGWAPDYGGASTFLGVFRCGSDSWFVGNYCDPEYDAAYQRALDTQASGDAAAAGAQWAALDRSIVDLALIVPMYNAGGDVVSSRVGNYQVSPSGIVLFDQMWVL